MTLARCASAPVGASPPRQCRFGYRRVLPTASGYGSRAAVGQEKTAARLAICTSSCTHARTRSSGGRATTWRSPHRSHSKVPTLGGPPVKLRLSPGTPNGRTLRVRGKGVRKRDGTKGDLLVTVEVLVPQALNEQARDALNSYAEAVGSVNPRAKLFAADEV